MTAITKADLKGKNILFIAYFYPPVDSTGVPGAMRTVKFIRNMTNGSFHVLTTPPRVDEKSSALGHLSLPVNGEKIYRINAWDIFKLLLAFRQTLKSLLRRKTPDSDASTKPTSDPFKSGSRNEDSPGVLQRFKDFIYNACYFPDQAGPWILPAIKKGRNLIKKEKIDVIFATGSPWSGLIAGYYLSKLTRKPLIVDFRDPWMNNPFHHSKGKLLDGISAKLERKVIAHASAVSLNTIALYDDFVRRYPFVSENKFFVLPNGFDEIDFQDIEPQNTHEPSNAITICHTGFLYGVRDPSVLLEAIKSANVAIGDQGPRIRFQQVGQVSLDYDIEQRYADMIENGSLVLDPPTSYKECLQILKNSDWVANIQPNTNTQIPSKLYDYLALRKPIINITPQSGALGRLVKAKGLGELFDFNEVDALTNRLIEISQNHSEWNNFSGYNSRADFLCSKITEDLANRINSISSS
ncbi:glycosyltransferase [Mangrovitalea sediminis]|uniref:glycosyltransferase n=1 Tax=Mangrovitalea sediminis TaxID=1982043 RepID=UPI000BE4E0CE|nr:glycosyltransferase [Mangrovitalea sediminis]